MPAHLRHLRHCTGLVATAVLLVVPAACSGDGGEGDAALRVAQLGVTTKEKALAEAEAEAVDAKAAFCSTSGAYVIALDRYGDVLTSTAPTVGDVKDAGEDLEQPGDDAASAAETAVAAQQAVTTAERELADAEATLVAAQASAAGTTPTSAPSSAAPTAQPSTPPASVTRVQQAEAELDTAVAGITDQTPLTQAAEQFNAAAVALEMAWIQLLSEAGCLTDEQQAQASTAAASYTATVQQALADAGYFTGEVDGVYGPQTVAAVEALQKANGLPQTGTMDKATEAALRSELAAKGGVAAQQETASTAAVQQTLKLAGYWDGPVDGQWTDELTVALEELQADLGVEVTGTVDAATIAAFEKALEDAGTPASPSPSESASATVEPTASG